MKVVQIQIAFYMIQRTTEYKIQDWRFFKFVETKLKVALNIEERRLVRNKKKKKKISLKEKRVLQYREVPILQRLNNYFPNSKPPSFMIPPREDFNGNSFLVQKYSSLVLNSERRMILSEFCGASNSLR